MSGEIAESRKNDFELLNAKQEVEILNLKFELQKLQGQKASRLEDSLFAPSLFNHYQKVAETLSKSNMIPTIYKNKPEDIFVAMAMGYQLGFPVEQSLQDIAVINGRPCLWGDGLLSLVLNHPECQDIKEEPIYTGQVVTGYICTVLRKGHHPHSKTFTLQDAERAGLLRKGGVWTSYPERMLQMRARGLALRDKFADALRGLRVAEVEQDDSEIIDAQVVSIEDNNRVEKLKSILKGNPQKELTNKNENNKSETSSKDKTSSANLKISPEVILKIQQTMEEKGFDEERKKKAFEYFNIESIDQLTNSQASVFLTQLSKAQEKK